MNYERSELIDQLAKALTAAQAVMHAAAKDKKNPHFGSRYADLAACFDACRAPLAENGLAILQPTSSNGASVTVTTLLAHVSGQWISSELTITADKATAQALGSAVSYARRYGLSALIGLAADDDDGNEASGRGNGAPEAQERGSKKAAQDVASRKVQEMQAKPSKNPKMLEAFAQVKAQLGDALYDMVLREFEYDSAEDIPDRERGDAVYKRMGVVNKIAQAASHGELLTPGITPEIFERLPESSVAAVRKEYQEKLKQYMTEAEAFDIFEKVRLKCADNWTFCNALEVEVKKQAKARGIAS